MKKRKKSNRKSVEDRKKKDKNERLKEKQMGSNKDGRKDRWTERQMSKQRGSRKAASKGENVFHFRHFKLKK